MNHSGLQDELISSSAKDADLIASKHQQIVLAACHLFFKKGYHKTTIREIAIEAGMSMGQLYHYISSKDDVLFLVYRHMQLMWYDHLMQSGVEDIDNPIQRLEQAIRHTIEFMVENRELFLFVYTETKYLEKKYLKVVLEMDDKSIVGFWRRMIHDADIQSRNERQIAFLANLISYLMVFLPLRGWNIRQIPNQEQIDSLIDFILNGLGFK